MALSAEEESVPLVTVKLLLADALFFFGVTLFTDVIEEEPESDELAVENRLVEGEPEEEVEEDDE